MSTVYATEPATAGRVIIETSDGPLEIHLWSRECPHTTRLFLQLCMDGFYNDMVFHRIVNNFMIQTGALRHSNAAPPFSMSSPEAASYRQAIQATQALERQKYEVNSRIRFNHRGQVAMAMGASSGDNNNNKEEDAEDLQPQFFITLEDAEYLNSKHVVFGTVSGPTIFNALRIGRTETDEATAQPLDLPNATRIVSVKIVENPLHQDLVPQPNVPWTAAAALGRNKQDDDKQPKKKKKKRKGKFDTNVLSFGAEFEEEEEEGGTATTALATRAVKKKGMQSSHDLLVESKVLSKQVVDDKVKDVVMDAAKDSNTSTSGIDAKAAKRKRRLDQGGDNDTTTTKNDESAIPTTTRKESEPSHTFSARKDRDDKAAKVNNQSADEEDETQQVQDLKAAAAKISNALPKLSAVEARRRKYTKEKKSKQEREEETLAKLTAFRSTVQEKVEERKSSSRPGQQQKQQDDSLAARMARRAEKANGGSSNDNIDGSGEQAPAYDGQLLESDEDDNGEQAMTHGAVKRTWLGTSFKCRKHMDHATRNLGGDGRAADDYEIVDTKDGKHRHKKHKHGHHHHKSGGHKHHNRDKAGGRGKK